MSRFSTLMKILHSVQTSIALLDSVKEDLKPIPPTGHPDTQARISAVLEHSVHAFATSAAKDLHESVRVMANQVDLLDHLTQPHDNHQDSPLDSLRLPPHGIDSDKSQSG